MSTLQPLSAHVAANPALLLEAVCQHTFPAPAGEVLSEDVFWILRKYLKPQTVLRRLAAWRADAPFALIRLSSHARNVGLLIGPEPLDDPAIHAVTDEYGFDAVIFADEQTVYENPDAFAAFVAAKFPQLFSERGRINLGTRDARFAEADTNWRVVSKPGLPLRPYGTYLMTQAA